MDSILLCKKEQMAADLLLVQETSRHPSLVKGGLPTLPSKKSYAADNLATLLVESTIPEKTDDIVALSGESMVQY